MAMHHGDTDKRESSTVRRKMLSPPVSPVSTREVDKQEQRFTAKQHCGATQDGDARAVAVAAVAPTPTSVVMLRRHFSKQRQAHERITQQEVVPSILDPITFSKHPVRDSTARWPPPCATGCLAGTRGRLLHFLVLDEPLQAAQRRLALALVAEARRFHMGDTCLRRVLEAVSSNNPGGVAATAKGDAQPREAARRADPSGARLPLAERTMQQAASDLVSRGTPDCADVPMLCNPDRGLLLP
eukprot:COSAG02_NODE_1731_length_11173_cov_6.039281_14_plen_242_part_00